VIRSEALFIGLVLCSLNVQSTVKTFVSYLTVNANLCGKTRLIRDSVI
jgi:hypothetical protein